MLMLKIREGETVTVGGITIKFFGIRNHRAEIGFDGPREIPVIRGNARKRDHLGAPLRAALGAEQKAIDAVCGNDAAEAKEDGA